jgi:hypothetical protein
MPEKTDPATELALLCEKLARPSRDNGLGTLAVHFRTKNGSVEFYRVLTCIHERISQVIEFAEQASTLQPDFKKQAIERVRNLRKTFTAECLVRPWTDGAGGASHLQDSNVFALKMLSGDIAKHVSHPKLSEDEIKAVVGHVVELKEWLADKEISEHDFIRQLILDGLANFQFRLERLEWVGTAFALESFKDVIASYLILEGKEPSVVTNPDSKAVLMKVGSAIKGISSAIGLVKETTEKGQFMITALKACATVVQHPATTAALGFAAGSAS